MGHYVSIHSGSSIDEATTRIYNVSPGIATASRAIVLDENKDISGIRNITCAGGILLSGSISASNRLSYWNNNGVLSYTDLYNWITGSNNQITITDNGTGTVTLTVPFSASIANRSTDLSIASSSFSSSIADLFIASSSFSSSIASGVYAQQVVTVAKSGMKYTSIQSAINSITDAASDKIYTVLVYPGEYDEAITLKNYVDIVAIDPSATKILRQVTDNNVECHCYLNITIESASGRGLHTQNANTVVKVDGNVSSSTDQGAYCLGGTQTINGNVSSTSSASQGAFCEAVALVAIQTIHGNCSSINNRGAHCGIGGVQTIYGDVSGKTGISVNGGTQVLYGNAFGSGEYGAYLVAGKFTIDGNITCTYDNSNGHGVKLLNVGTFIQRNGTIYVTHADAKAVYAATAKNVYLMNVWSNRELHANITNLITGGFTYDADVPDESL